MNKNSEYLKNIFKNESDFIIRDIPCNKEKIYIVYFESLINSSDIYEYTIKSIQNYLIKHKSINCLRLLLNSPKLLVLKDITESLYYLESGFYVCLYKDELYAIEAKANIDRGIQISDTEPSMYGPKDAFCENYQKNLGLIKRRIKSNKLSVQSYELGDVTKTKISVCSVKGISTPEREKAIYDKLSMLKSVCITDSEDICKLLELNKIFPTILKTEKPAVVSKYLLKGYVVILIDNTPFSLIIDAKLKDFVNPSTTDSFIKILRYLCLILTVITPAFYIALINFNQETIPTSLLINFIMQRSGVPFPAIIEATLMLLVCEILRETDIRFPNSYGSSASILGALILGDAAVNAGLVSPIMIIIIAITFITNLIFTEIRLVGAIRIFRVVLLVVASTLGLYGLSIAMLVLIAAITNVKMYIGEYV